MGKISDLWVRLGLKKDEFDKGIDDVKKKGKETEGVFSKIKGAGLAVWAAIGASAIKFAGDLKGKTNALSDAWDVMTAKMQARWNTFLEAVTNGFDGFTNKMKQSVAAAEAYAQAMDANFEIQNAFKLQRAEMAAELAALEIAMRDATKTFDERLKAIADYKEKQGKLYKDIADQANFLKEKTLDKFIAGGDLPNTQQVRDDLTKLLKNGFADRELLGALGTMLGREKEQKAAEDLIAYQRSIGQYNPEFEAAYMAKVPAAVDLSKWQKDYGTDLVELYRLYNNYRNDAEVMQLVQSLIDAWQAEAQQDIDQRRISTLEASLRNQQANEQKAHEIAAGVEQTFEEVLAEARREIEEGMMEDIALDPIEIVPIEFDFKANEEGLEEIKNKYAKHLADIQYLNDQFNAALNESIVGGVQAITDVMAGLDGMDASHILSALMNPFADMAIQLGTMLIATGTGVEAFKKSLEGLDGPVALAAGIALVALGSAMKSGIRNLAQGGGTSASTYSGGSSGGVQTIESEMTIYVEGKISGNDIVLAGQKTLRNWGR